MMDRVWAENGRNFDRGWAARWLVFVLSFFVIASLAGFFLFPSGKINNFPTYLAGLLTLFYLMLHPDVLRWVWKSRVFLVSVSLAVYLTLTAFWSAGGRGDTASTFGSLVLIVTMLFAIAICARKLTGFVNLLVSFVIVAATLSAGHFLLTGTEQAWGRLHTPTIACLAYGLGAVLAATFCINGNAWPERVLWATCTLVLAVAGYVLGTGYVLFGVLTATVVIGGLYFWRNIGTRRVYPLLAACTVLVAAQFLTFSHLLEADRQLIWQPVVDMAYEANPVFGSGVLTESKPGLECNVAEDVAAPAGDCVIQHPHNIYIATMYYGGVVGLGLLLLLVLAALACTIEAPHPSKPVVLGALAYSFSVLMFDGNRLIHNIDFIWLLFWLPVGLAIVLDIQSRELEDDEEEANLRN